MKNFLRYSRIQLKDGTIIDSDQYNIEFEVQRRFGKKINKAIIRILYINKATFLLFRKDEEITLSAGYKKGEINVIFSGKITKVKGEDYDSIILFCHEGKDKLETIVVNESFTPGVRASTIINYIFQTYNLKKGNIEIPIDYVFSRGFIIIKGLDECLEHLCDILSTVRKNITQDPGKTMSFYEKKGLFYFEPSDTVQGTRFLTANNGLLTVNEEEIKNEKDLNILGIKKDEQKNIQINFTSKISICIEEGDLLEIEGINNKYRLKIDELIFNSDNFTIEGSGVCLN